MREGKVAVGAQAPDFTLRDDAGRDVRLADFRGRWVHLFFYPKADTPG
jgi:thioredoxin-dependent peroxiredoxin